MKGDVLDKENVSFRKRRDSYSAAVANDSDIEKPDESAAALQDKRELGGSNTPSTKENLPRLFNTKSRFLTELCNCRKDSISSTVSSYHGKRRDSTVSVSTCQSLLLPSSVRNSIGTLSNPVENFRKEISQRRRHSDHNCSGRIDARINQRRYSDHNTDVGKNLKDKKRRDSLQSLNSMRRDSGLPVTPKMYRRRFSEQLILEGGLRSDIDVDEQVEHEEEEEEDEEPEESLTTMNARKRITLKKHYYPEGRWGFTVVGVAVLIQMLCHGLQMGSGPLVVSTMQRFNQTSVNSGRIFLD